MQAETLKAVAVMKHLSQSDLARAAGVSRQRVSQWFLEADADGFINIQMKHARLLSAALKIDLDTLTKKLPLLNNDQRHRHETANLLWDRLYPDVVSLFAAAMNGERDALARVVQVYGLYEAAKFLGERVWKEFPHYKSFLKPVRRIQLEALCQYRQSQTKV
jgi:transcriptional regulator with XRE-family HTH domain